MTDKATLEGSRFWRQALIPASASLEEAIRNLNQSALQIVLVVSPEGALLGTITDGDIRRGLLRGLDLKSSVDGIMRRDPFIVTPQMDREVVLQIMRANEIHQLPVVDEGRRVVGLHVWEKLLAPRELSNLMVIMAGGRGTRLRPRTENCPKPLLPLRGKPLLEHIIERAKAEGFRRFALAVHYLGHMIEAYFGDGARWEVNIQYLREDCPLGTAGAISLLQPRPELPVLVSNGDVMTHMHYGELLDFHGQHGATATMAVRPYEWQHPFGVVRTKGVDMTGFEEKPIFRTHVNAGIYVIEPSAVECLVPGEHCDMPVLFGRLLARGHRTIVYPVHEPWYDMGHANDFEQAEANWTPA